MPMSSHRTIFVLNSLALGGSESKIVRLANELARRNYMVTMAYLNEPTMLLDRLSASVDVIALGRRGKYSIGALRRLATAHRSENATFVAVNLYPLLYALPASRMRLGGPSRVIGLVNTAQGSKGRAGVGRFYASLLRRCDLMVFGCKSEMSAWTTTYGLPLALSECIYNGVETSYFSETVVRPSSDALRQQLGIPRDAVVIGSVGRLAPEKRFDLLVSALSQLASRGQPVFLLLVGDGPERGMIERLIGEYRLVDRAALPGSIPDVRPYLGAMDIFALPSDSVETFSNAALEAMAMSRPVVLSQCGGAAEMIESGVSGFLVPTGDLEALTGTLGQLVQDGNLRQRVGSLARLRVENRFEFQAMVECYARVCGLHAPPEVPRA